MNQTLHPLLQYSILSAGLLASLLLFLTVRGIHRVDKGMRVGQQALDERCGAIERKLIGLRARQVPAEAPDPEAAPWAQGMDSSRRVLALNLSRRGESPEHIATALRLPLNEVTLLLKVHRMVSEPRMSMNG